MKDKRLFTASRDLADASDSATQYVIFRVEQEEYCVEILKVQEIIRMVPITWLPRKPEYIIGVINLRGEIIPIIDLRLKFGLGKKDYSKFTRILIAQINEQLVGMIVDAVEEVLMLQSDQIEHEPEMISSSRSSDYIQGIAKIEERVIIILDIARVLSRDDVLNLTDVTLGGASSVKETPERPTPGNQ